MSQQSFSSSVSSHRQVPILLSCPFVPANGISKNYPTLGCSSHPVFSVFFFFLTAPRSMWDLSSPTRDQICTPCFGSSES